MELSNKSLDSDLPTWPGVTSVLYMGVCIYVHHRLACVHTWWSEVYVKHLLYDPVLSLGGLEVHSEFTLNVGAQVGSE